MIFFLNQQNLIPVYLKRTSDPGFNLRRFKKMKASSDVNILKGGLSFGLGTKKSWFSTLVRQTVTLLDCGSTLNTKIEIKN